MKTGTLVIPPEHNPARESFRFEGWTLDGQPYDFQTPILQDITLTAKWAKTTDWTLSPNHGPSTGAQLTISPPDKQEPYYTSIHAAGDQIVGLTGDGRIYTWTQNSTPKQVPFPTQAADGFHYLQIATSSQSQAALGSDQHIYTWNSRQATPTILDTSRNTRFTSISLNDDRLLAVDQQGQVHTFQTRQTDTQDLNPKFAEQVTTSLPGRAQAVTAVTAVSRILIVDANGQAWTWDADNTGKAKPVRVKQDQGIRIIQAQALNQGFLLLDADGQAWYLADSTTSPTALSLPDGAKTSLAIANNDQALITGTEGRVWTWEPGDTPVRADNGNKQYIQAVSVGSRITAICRQGSIVAWSLDAQGKPGKPARLNTTQAPTLESASLDSQPLKLTKTGDVWQTPIPARKPGPAAITITGRQDGQPFTRSLNYTVDQQLTRDTEPNTTHTVTFNTDSGTPTPANQQVSYPYGRVQRPSPDPTRDGYQFDGWFTGSIAYDFSKPVTTDLTLTAHWTFKNPNNTWRINPDKGSQLGNETTTITPPASHSGIKFNQVSGGRNSNGYGFSLAVGSDGNAYAWGYNGYGQLGDKTRTSRNTPVMVRTPDRKTYPDLPEDFTYVQVSAGDDHSLALGSDGYVYAWGNNSNGELGNNTTSNSLVPVRVRDPAKPTDTSKGLQATQVSAGRGWGHSLAVGSDGYAYAWGYNDYGQLGNNTPRTDSHVPVRVRDPAKPTDTSKGLQATQVSAGWMYSLAVGSDGYAYAWGNNEHGQLGNNTDYDSSVPVRVRDPASPTDTSKGLQATQISGGGRFSLAVGSDGYAYAWGNNSNGELGNNTTSNSLVPVRVRDPAKPTDTSKGLQATQVSAGYYNSLAVGSDGNAYAWGNNSYGQLGNGNTSPSTVPVPVVFNLQPVITGVKFDSNAGTNLTRGDSNSVTVLTPAHQPGTVTVSVDYTLGGAPQTPDTSLRYTYLPAGVLPKAGGEGILLALATGMTGMGGVLASHRHRKETRQLSHASRE